MKEDLFFSPAEVGGSPCYYYAGKGGRQKVVPFAARRSHPSPLPPSLPFFQGPPPSSSFPLPTLPYLLSGMEFDKSAAGGTPIAHLSYLNSCFFFDFWAKTPLLPRRIPRPTIQELFGSLLPPLPFPRRREPFPFSPSSAISPPVSSFPCLLFSRFHKLKDHTARGEERGESPFLLFSL